MLTKQLASLLLVLGLLAVLCCALELASMGPSEHELNVTDESELASGHQDSEDSIQLMDVDELADRLRYSIVTAEEPEAQGPQVQLEGEPEPEPELAPEAFTKTQAQASSESAHLDLSHGPHNPWSLVRVFHGFYYHRMYNRINDYLVDATNSTRFEVNMRVLREWLEGEKAKGVRLLTNRALVEALEQLVALDSVKDKCDRIGYSALWRNDRATSGQAHVKRSKLSPTPRRIVWLVHKASLEHAIHCHHAYPANYRQIREQLADDLSIQRVEGFLNAIINDRLAVSNNPAALFNQLGADYCGALEIISKITSLDSKRTAEIAHEAIKALSSNDPRRVYLGKVIDEKKGALTVNAPKIRELVQEYLVEPCKHFQRTFGPDVYLPAGYDVRMLEHEDRYSMQHELLDGFIYGWVRFHLCGLLITRDQDKLTKRIINIISKQH